jgi:hypothetical protein
LSRSEIIYIEATFEFKFDTFICEEYKSIIIPKIIELENEKKQLDKCITILERGFTKRFNINGLGIDEITELIYSRQESVLSQISLLMPSQIRKKWLVGPHELIMNDFIADDLELKNIIRAILR